MHDCTLNGQFTIAQQKLALLNFYFVAMTTTPPWCEGMINNINWPSKGFPINAIIDSVLCNRYRKVGSALWIIKSAAPRVQPEGEGLHIQCTCLYQEKMNSST